MIRWGNLLHSAASPYSQVTQSAVSLITTLVFAHNLSPSEFGLLSGFWLVWMLWLSMNRSVFSEQLIAQGLDARSSYGYRDFVVTWLIGATILSLILGTLLGQHKIIPGIVYIAAFVGSDAVRYYVMAATKKQPFWHVRMIIVDTCRLLLALLALVASTLALPSWISFSLVTFGAGFWLVMGLKFAKAFSLKRARHYLMGKGHFEKLLSIQFIFGTGISQSAPLLTLLSFGPSALGGIRLTQSLLSPITLVSTAFQPTLLHEFAVKSRTSGLRRSFTTMFVVSVVAAVALASTANVVLDLASDSLVPAGYRDVVGDVSLPISIMLAAAVIGQPGGAVIRVYRLGSASLSGQLIGVVATVLLCLSAMQESVSMFAWAMAAGSSTTVLATYGFILFQLRTKPNDSWCS